MKKSLLACALLAQFALSSAPAQADETLPNPKTTSYLCTASYLVREEVKYSSRPSGTFWALETRVVSTISEDYSGSIGGGGGSPFGGRNYYAKDDDGKKAVFEAEQTLMNAKKEKLGASGHFSNGYRTSARTEREFNFEVTFFDKKADKQLGPEFKIVGEGTQIAEVAKNEFIQVNCSFVRRFKTRD